jgi:uncharacterized membrane protein YdjX (TVP38/TMEM64 family)
MVAQSALGEPLRARAGPALQRFADGFRHHALSYVFLLHLVPIFPYAVVICIPAACGVGLRTFVISAFLGLVPGTLLFAYLGAGLDDVLSAGRPIGLASFLRLDIVSAFAGLVVLALLPVAYRAWFGSRTGALAAPRGGAQTGSAPPQAMALGQSAGAPAPAPGRRSRSNPPD